MTPLLPDPTRRALPRNRLTRNKPGRNRRGGIIFLTASMLIVLIVLIALAVDVGCLTLARAQLQNAADAASLAAACELLEQKLGSARPLAHVPDEEAILEEAARFAGYNKVISDAESSIALPQADVITGLLTNPSDLAPANPGQHNAVQVRVSRTDLINGNVKTFFAPVMGTSGVDVTAQATAGFCQNFIGFRPPGGTANLPILPFALDEISWQAVSAGEGDDDWSWDPVMHIATAGQDNRPEIRLYPVETGSDNNYGLVDVGSNDSDNTALRRQITEGLAPTDLTFHGGELRLNEEGELILSADPGLKTYSIENELHSIVGQPKIIFLYRSVTGDGGSAEYLIVGFAAVRIVSVDLQGAYNAVMIQPAPMIQRGGIQAPAGQKGSDFIYSSAVLVR